MVNKNMIFWRDQQGSVSVCKLFVQELNKDETKLKQTLHQRKAPVL